MLFDSKNYFVSERKECEMSRKRIYIALLVMLIVVASVVVFFQYGNRTKDVFDGVLVWNADCSKVFV